MVSDESQGDCSSQFLTQHAGWTGEFSVRTNSWKHSNINIEQKWPFWYARLWILTHVDLCDHQHSHYTEQYPPPLEPPRKRSLCFKLCQTLERKSFRLAPPCTQTSRILRTVRGGRVNQNRKLGFAVFGGWLFHNEYPPIPITNSCFSPLNILCSSLAPFFSLFSTRIITFNN